MILFLLVDKGQKQVSSTVGHELMHGHPFAEQRFVQAHDHISKLIDVFATGNLKEFIHIVESEALTLHAMMMTSMPYFILMKPNTLEHNSKDLGISCHFKYPSLLYLGCRCERTYPVS